MEDIFRLFPPELSLQLMSDIGCEFNWPIQHIGEIFQKCQFYEDKIFCCSTDEGLKATTTNILLVMKSFSGQYCVNSNS